MRHHHHQAPSKRAFLMQHRCQCSQTRHVSNTTTNSWTDYLQFHPSALSEHSSLPVWLTNWGAVDPSLPSLRDPVTEYSFRPPFPSCRLASSPDSDLLPPSVAAAYLFFISFPMRISPVWLFFFSFFFTCGFRGKTTENYGYSDTTYSDNRLQWQFFVPKRTFLILKIIE